MTTLMQVLMDLPTTVIVLLKMTVLLGVGWVLHFAMVRRNRRWRVFVWRGVLAGLLLLPVAELVLPRLEVPVAPAPTVVEATTDMISYEPAFAAPTEVSFAPAATVPTVEAPDSPGMFAWMKEQFSILLLAAWGLVATIMAMKCLFSVKDVRRMVKGSRSAPLRLYRLMDRVAEGTNCRNRVNVRLSPDLGSPFLAGLIRPVMVLPERMADEDHADELPAVLAHELAHLNSYDLIWMTLGRWLSVLLWFHPLVWKLRAAHAAACEQVCDAVAADYAGGAPAYSRTLARLALELVVDVPMAGGIPMIRTSEITRRLRNLKRGIKAAALARPWVVASVLLGCVTLLGIGCLKLVSADRAQTSQAVSASVETEGPGRYTFGPVIERWINDDDAGEDFGIDFDTGLLGDPSPKNGKSVDGMVDVSGKPKNIICFDMVVLAADHVWEGDPNAIAERVQGCKAGSHVYMSAEGELPKSFLFRTREGGMGVLQILELSDTEEPRGVRVRYKLLQEEAEGEGRILRFPEDRSMGRLMIRDAGGHARPYDGWVDFCEAGGEVRVPEGKQLQLVPSRDAGKDFAPLGRLRPDDLAWINCWHVPVDDDGLRHIAGLTGLGALTLRYAPITDKGLEHLKDLTSLVALNLFGTKVRGEGLTHLSGMRSLQRLTLSGSAITDEGLSHLPEFPSLIHLGLASLDITDAGLAHIENMRSLKELRLYATRITDEGLISVAQLTSLEELGLHGTEITDAGLANLKPLQSLRRLDFREGLRAVGDEGLAHLKELKSLESLALSDRVTGKGLEYLREFPSLKWISGISSDVILEKVAELPNMQSVESLGIKGDGVTDVGMDCVARLEGLKSVRLSRCNVTNEGLAKLAVLRPLQSLELWNTAVTSSGLEHLAELPSLSQLWFVGFVIDKTGLAHLGDLTRLELLHVDGADVRDDDLKHLVNLHHMKSLRLQSSEITDQGIAHLSGLTSLEELDIPRGGLTDEGLGQLAELKKLNYLLVQGKFSDRGLEYLEKLPLLGSLTLIGGEFSAEGLARFRRRMPSLRYLNVGQAG